MPLSISARTTPSFRSAPITLRPGARGEDVERMQRLLSARGHDVGSIDGSFGPRTTAAVRAFQSARGLSVDGVVGPATWRALGAAAPVTPSQPSAARSPPAYFAFASDVGRGSKAIDAQLVRDVVSRHGSNVLIGVDAGALATGEARPVIAAARAAGARTHVYVEGPGGVTGTQWTAGELARTKARASQVGIDTSRPQSAWMREWREGGWKQFTRQQLSAFKREGFESAEIDNLYNGIARDPENVRPEEHVSFYADYARWFRAGEVPRLMLKNLDGPALSAVVTAVNDGRLPRTMFADFHIAEANTGNQSEQTRQAARLGITTLHTTDTHRYHAFGAHRG
jgi:peptidoglycan hydrolase-like protein with peptidoglycan-binding domain